MGKPDDKKSWRRLLLPAKQWKKLLTTLIALPKNNAENMNNHTEMNNPSKLVHGHVY